MFSSQGLLLYKHSHVFYFAMSVYLYFILKDRSVFTCIYVVFAQLWFIFLCPAKTMMMVLLDRRWPLLETFCELRMLRIACH